MKPFRSRFVSFFLLAFCLPLRAAEFSHRAEVIRIESLTQDVKRISLRVSEQGRFAFKPGQYVFLKVPGDYVKRWNERYGTSHREISRPYSFASSPSRLPVFDLIIKHASPPPGKDVPPGLASTYVHKSLKVGDEVGLSEPAGDLYSGDDSKRAIVLIAGGVGVSPFAGLLEYWFENKMDQERQIYLFLGVHGKHDLLLHEQFKNWAARKRNFFYIPALSGPREPDGWPGATGYINLVLKDHPAGSLDADFYLAGSPIMMRETIKVLKSKGVPKDRIHHDPIPEK